MLTQEQIENMQTEISDIETMLAQITDTQNAKRQENSDLGQKIKQYHQDIDKMSFEKNQIADYLQTSRREYDGLLHKSLDIAKKIEEDALEKQIAERMQQHPDFWSEVDTRIRVLQAEINSNFVQSIDPATALSRLRKESERLTFGGVSYTVNTNKGAYERKLRDLVIKQIHGKNLEINEIKHLSSIVDNFLEQPQIRPYWLKS